MPPPLTVTVFAESTVTVAPEVPVSVPVPEIVTLPAVDVFSVWVVPVEMVVSAKAGVVAKSPAAQPRATGATEARNCENLRCISILSSGNWPFGIVPCGPWSGWRMAGMTIPPPVEISPDACGYIARGEKPARASRMANVE